MFCIDILPVDSRAENSDSVSGYSSFETWVWVGWEGVGVGVGL